MSAPLKAGDRALVINGMAREKSPNVGQEVVVKQLRGQHSRFGNVWRCEGPDLVQFAEDGVGFQKLGWADFPAIWLQKIEPEKPKETQREASKEES